MTMRTILGCLRDLRSPKGEREQTAASCSQPQADAGLPGKALTLEADPPMFLKTPTRASPGHTVTVITATPQPRMSALARAQQRFHETQAILSDMGDMRSLKVTHISPKASAHNSLAEASATGVLPSSSPSAAPSTIAASNPKPPVVGSHGSLHEPGTKAPSVGHHGSPHGDVACSQRSEDYTTGQHNGLLAVPHFSSALATRPSSPAPAAASLPAAPCAAGPDPEALVLSTSGDAADSTRLPVGCTPAASAVAAAPTDCEATDNCSMQIPPATPHTLSPALGPATPSEYQHRQVSPQPSVVPCDVDGVKYSWLPSSKRSSFQASHTPSRFSASGAYPSYRSSRSGVITSPIATALSEEGTTWHNPVFLDMNKEAV